MKNIKSMYRASNTEQSIKGLEAAYLAVFNRPLEGRVKELVTEYGDRVDYLCSELNPGNPVPCFYKISELAKHYKVTA